MKYMVGYQMMAGEQLIDTIIEQRAAVYEVYFSWGDIPNGRNSQLMQTTLTPWEAQERQCSDLKRLSDNGIALNLLLNGNCYGKDSLSRAFFQKLGDTVDYIIHHFGLASVTTTSPVIAKFVRSNFADVEIRASVNMAIGTVQGMDYVSQYFDSYYMQREYNRDLKQIQRLKRWCDDNGKQLFLLANSGCLNHCSAHTFHDNLVAHEAEIAGMDNAYAFPGICWDYVKKSEKQLSLLRDTSFIRPEDMAFYDGYFTAAKLATRVSKNPVRILEAYLRGSYRGNVLDLLEPCHAGALYPHVIENKKIAPDFVQRVLACDKNCAQCGYCEQVFRNSLVDLERGIC